MKIGTISLNINTHDLNYGAVLHSWAFQKHLQKFSNVETEVIDYITPQFYDKNLKFPVLDLLQQGKIKSSVVSAVRLFSHAKRFDKFQDFVAHNFDVSAEKYSQEKLNQAKLPYDVVICESDVIWSPEFFGGDFDPAFFLQLDSMKNMVKIAYSPSMANGKLTKEQEEKLKYLTKDLDCISARETYTAAYLQKICKRDVDCVLDPVFLLNAEEYDKITAKRMIPEPYLLLYFPLEHNVEIIKCAKKYAKEHGLKLVELSRYPWDRLSHTTITDAGIEEFLSLIKYADMVFSNSFHAVCFSMIFGREFFGFSRRTGLKIKDICERLQVPERFIEISNNNNLPSEKVDYVKLNKILAKEIENSKSFIQKSIPNLVV